MNLTAIDITIPGLQSSYLSGEFTPRQLIQEILRAIESDSNPVFIHRLTNDEVEPYLAALESKSASDLPLYGIPFAIKDNIDLAGVPTTAACADYSYLPETHAKVVQLLIDAGAIPVGKTNMDQFATGLVGVRSPEPWGICHNSFNSEYIAGGSSSGSAVAVANGWVSFSLGTDTAGSGRVPAAFNNIIGLKPTRGLLSTHGVVPACRSLDSVSIFALTAADANAVFDIAAIDDTEDSYSRKNVYANAKRYFNPVIESLRIGVPATKDLEFFGNSEAETLFTKGCEKIEAIGHTCVAIDFSPFVEAAKLLYEGPWVNERYIAIKDIFENNGDALLPVIKTIVGSGKQQTAEDTFNAIYKLQALAAKAKAQLEKVDAIVTPTAGTCYKIEDVLNNPIQFNSNLGYYTNFMNLLDCAAIAVPVDKYSDTYGGVGFGVTFFHQSFNDKRLLSLAAQWQHHNPNKLGNTSQTFHSIKKAETKTTPYETIKVVVCGAHMSGLPLNWQLVERGAHLVEVTQTAPCYRFYALAGGPPKRPGLIRVTENGAAIAVEVWEVPVSAFGSFVQEIPSPLGIGKVQLMDGRFETGFICEAAGVEGAEEITALGAWWEFIKG